MVFVKHLIGCTISIQGNVTRYAFSTWQVNSFDQSNGKDN